MVEPGGVAVGDGLICDTAPPVQLTPEASVLKFTDCEDTGLNFLPHGLSAATTRE